MADSDSYDESEKSPPPKKSKGGAKNSGKMTKTRSQTRHEISDSNSDSERPKVSEKSVGGGGFSAVQMKEFASMISAAMGSAFAQVASTHAQNDALLPPKSKQDGGALSEEHESGEEDKEQDEIDDYDKSLDSMLGNQETVGPDLSDKVGRVLEKCLGPALDEKMVKEKRDLYPRPGNIVNLSVPRLNPEIYKRVSGEHQFGDKALQQIQSFMVASMISVGYQAELALKVRSWFHGLNEEDREKLPPELVRLSKTYVGLMDANVLMTRAMWEVTALRRKIVKNDLVEPYKGLLDDDKTLPPLLGWQGMMYMPLSRRQKRMPRWQIKLRPRQHGRGMATRGDRCLLQTGEVFEAVLDRDNIAETPRATITDMKVVTDPGEHQEGEDLVAAAEVEETVGIFTDGTLGK